MFEARGDRRKTQVQKSYAITSLPSFLYFTCVPISILLSDFVSLYETLASDSDEGDEEVPVAKDWNRNKRKD